MDRLTIFPTGIGEVTLASTASLDDVITRQEAILRELKEARFENRFEDKEELKTRDDLDLELEEEIV